MSSSHAAFNPVAAVDSPVPRARFLAAGPVTSLRVSNIGGPHRHEAGGRASRRFLATVLASLLLLPQAGCMRTVAERGVEPLWRSVPADVMVRGVTTKAEVLERLGPPSQVITEGRGEIFYYLHEETRTRGLVLVVYNKSETVTRYDRAIFFFDADGVLKEYALSAASEGGP